MIAVVVLPDVVLAGIEIPEHRTLEVLADGDDAVDERPALTPAQARALVEAGYAEAVEADFDELAGLIDDWQRAG